MPTSRRLLSRTAAAAAILAGCLDHDPARPPGLVARLSIAADVSAGSQVIIAVSYARRQGPAVALTEAAFGVSEPGSRDLPLEVDIAPCIADPERAVTVVAGACPLLLNVRLLDALAVTVDQTTIGPVEAAPGIVAPPQPVSLNAVATIELVSGDDQVGWVGSTLLEPVVVRLLDRGGAPIAGRTITVQALEGGGTPVGQGAIVTGADGRATVSYRLGSASGTQRFSFSSTIGTASNVATANAVRVPRGTVSASVRSSCAIRPQGTMCWGANSLGSVGNPAVAVDTGLPVPVSGAPAFTAIAGTVANNITAHGMCGLNASGGLLCWGVNEQGGLGVPTAGNAACSATPGGPTTCQTIPAVVSAVPPLQVMRMGGGVGFYHVRICGVSLTGEAWCWGENASGGVGDGGTVTSGSPRLVAGGKKWISVGTGQSTTCGVDNRGKGWCWGLGTTGELGIGVTTSTTSPVEIQSAERFQDIGVGTSFACGLTMAGAVHCWGRDPGVPASGSFLPRSVSGSLAFTQMSVGLSAVCGVTGTGEVWCAGSGTLPGLGDGTNNNSSSFVRALLPSPATEVVVGNLHACALLQNSDLYCWGASTGGILGIGPKVASVRPMRVNFSGATPGVVASVVPYYTDALPPAARGSDVAPSRLIVRALDANGLLVPGTAITWTTNAGSTVVPGVFGAVTSVNGVAQPQSWQLSTVPGPNTLTATAAGAPGAPSATFSIEGRLPGAPVQLACNAACTANSTNVGALVSQGVARVLVTDADGIAVSGVPVTVTSNGTGNRTSPPLPATLNTDANGFVIISNWTADTLVKADTITFSAAVPQGSPVRITAVGVPLAASKLRLTWPPAPQLAGYPVTPAPTAAVTDQYGNVITTATGNVTLQGGTELVGTLTAPLVSGVATFTNVIPQVIGTYGVNASFPGVTPASVVFEGAGVRIFPNPITIALGSSMQLTASVTGFPPATPLTVTWASSNPAIAPLSPTGLLTGVSVGTATVTATSTFDSRATHTVPLTVLPSAPTISLVSINLAGTSTPAVLSNITGEVDVTVAIAPNGHPLASWLLVLQNQTAAQVSLPGSFTFRLNTAEVIPSTGKLRFCNGLSSLSALVQVPGILYGPASQAITLSNPGTC